MGGLLARLAPMAWGGLSGPAVQAELQRLRIQAFTAGGGFKLVGGARQQAWLMEQLKHAMLQSPSFSALMFEIRADAQHPVDVKIVNGQADVFVDGFDSRFTLGMQEIDLADLNHLPTDPPPASPHAITRGEILAHAMAEARAGALGSDGDRDEYVHAHKAGIDAQNAYRDDIGQKGHRRPHPDDGGRNAAGNFEMTYDNGYREVWVKGETANSIHHIDRSTLNPQSYDAVDELRESMKGARGR